MSRNPKSEPVLARPKISYWRKLGGGSLGISILIHAILLGVGLVLIVAVIPAPPEKVVDFIASGGGSNTVSSTAKQQKRSNVVRSNASRVAAKDVVSNFTLPDPEASADMSTLGALGTGGIGGLAGLGSANTKGGGTGNGIGSGMGKGLGSGSGANPFGMINPTAGALVGNFFDIKQTNKREPTGFHQEQVAGIIRNFIADGWKERSLDKFYKAKKTLYQTKFYIPIMEADGAPKAFDCENEVEPSRWIVVYRGTVTPPKTGKFRFVGIGDDVLVVRFNGKHVFDYGYTTPTSDTKDGLMEKPYTMYTYESTPTWNQHRGGLARGPEFRAEAGKAYPIEILMSELPGVLFGAVLLIEETGVTYKRDSLSDAPILPLFRFDGETPKQPRKDGNAPPFDPKGPAWQIVGKDGKLDI